MRCRVKCREAFVAAWRSGTGEEASLARTSLQDKHAKQLASKLAARLQHCENERQRNDVTFALGLLQYKDEHIQKLVVEGFKVVWTQA